MRALIQNYLLCFGMIFFISCSGVRDKRTGIIGSWVSREFDYELQEESTIDFIFHKHGHAIFRLHLDANNIMVAAGMYRIQDDQLVFSAKEGWMLEGGKKVYQEEDDVTLKYEVLKLNLDSLVLRELKNSHEEIISFQRVIEE